LAYRVRLFLLPFLIQKLTLDPTCCVAG
jgi:hypothetical protein